MLEYEKKRLAGLSFQKEFILTEQMDQKNVWFVIIGNVLIKLLSMNPILAWLWWFNAKRFEFWWYC